MRTPLPILPAPPSSSSHLRDLRQERHDLSHQHPLQHHPDGFDFSIDISDHPACMHFSCLTWDGEHASTDDSHGNTQKRHLISHSVPGAACAAVMFTLCSMSSEAGLCSSVCLACLLVHVKISPSEREGGGVSCCLFEVTSKEGADTLRGMKGSRGAAKSFKA